VAIGSLFGSSGGYDAFVTQLQVHAPGINFIGECPIMAPG
jgi:hypothetical protein